MVRSISNATNFFLTRRYTAACSNLLGKVEGSVSFKMRPVSVASEQQESQDVHSREPRLRLT